MKMEDVWHDTDIKTEGRSTDELWRLQNLSLGWSLIILEWDPETKSCNWTFKVLKMLSSYEGWLNLCQCECSGITLFSSFTVHVANQSLQDFRGGFWERCSLKWLHCRFSKKMRWRMAFIYLFICSFVPVVNITHWSSLTLMLALWC